MRNWWAAKSRLAAQAAAEFDAVCASSYSPNIYFLKRLFFKHGYLPLVFGGAALSAGGTDHR
jgi:hypothetical protein